MTDDFGLTQGLSGIMDMAGNIFAGIRIAFTVLLFISPLLLAIAAFLYMRSFRHTIVLRKRTKGDTDIIVQTKWKVVKKRGEPEQIMLLKGRKKVPVPPQEALEIKANGTYFCEGYVSEGDEIKWIKINEKGDNVEFKALTTKDKSFYFNREKQANAKYNQENFWSFLNRNIGAIVLIIIVGMFLIFWEDVMKPITNLQTANVQISEAQAKITGEQAKLMGKLEAMINGKYQIIDEQQQINSAPAINKEAVE